jgi:hypothetical protein
MADSLLEEHGFPISRRNVGIRLRGFVDLFALSFRYGLVGHRQQTTAPEIVESTISRDLNDQYVAESAVSDHLEDLQDYPKLYDRIHLSNVPDYVSKLQDKTHICDTLHTRDTQ